MDCNLLKKYHNNEIHSRSLLGGRPMQRLLPLFVFMVLIPNVCLASDMSCILPLLATPVWILFLIGYDVFILGAHSAKTLSLDAVIKANTVVSIITIVLILYNLPCIGQHVVGFCITVFIFLLILALVWWLPIHRDRKQRLLIEKIEKLEE
jgi:hypothetical protein